nr:hypothetical protein [Tanacetum cinerariifolium]
MLQALIDRKKVVVTEDVIRQALHLDDADGMEYFPNDEIFTELARMGYEKPPPKLTFYKAFFSAQWKFLIHNLVQCVSAKRTVWNKFSYSMASDVICLATGRKFNFSKYIFNSMVRNVDSPSKFLMYPWFLQVIINTQVEDLSSYNNQYTSPALTQKVFANMRRLVKGFSRVENPLFATMLVQPQPSATKEVDEVQVPNAPTPSSLINEPSPPLQEPITTPLQDQPAPPSSPPHEQQNDTSESFMTILNTLMETYATLSQKGRIDDVSAATTKDVSAAEPTVFDDEKRKPISIAQARKNMIIYLKNMAGYKMEHFRGMIYDKVRPIFEREYNKVQTLFTPDKDVEEP